MTTQTQPTVASTVKGDVPELFSSWHVVTSTEYVANYGGIYQIVVTSKNEPHASSNHFTDLICDRDFNYLSASDNALESIRRRELDYETKTLSATGTIKSQSLKEQILDLSAKILQYSLGNLVFRAEGLHPISDAIIHIQCDGCVVDICFWRILGAFRGSVGEIDDRLCSALFHYGKIDGEKIKSVELVKSTFCFTI